MKQTKFQKDVLALAKAMEQGIRKTRPLVDTYVSRYERLDEKPSKVVYACAIGAAVVDGKKFADYADLTEADAYEVVKNEFSVVFEEPENDESLHDFIVHLNDTEHWGRGRIVAWLRRLAKLSEPPKQWTDVR